MIKTSIELQKSLVNKAYIEVHGKEPRNLEILENS